MLLSEKIGDRHMINVGTCPNCNEVVPFETTDKNNIYKCPLCKEDARQYVNGKILYSKIIWDLEDGEQKD